MIQFRKRHSRLSRSYNTGREQYPTGDEVLIERLNVLCVHGILNGATMISVPTMAARIVATPPVSAAPPKTHAEMTRSSSPVNSLGSPM